VTDPVAPDLKLIRPIIKPVPDVWASVCRVPGVEEPPVADGEHQIASRNGIVVCYINERKVRRAQCLCRDIAFGN